MNKVEESVGKLTNCKSTEGVPTLAPEVENSSWASESRDWGDVVERDAADAENELNSSPQLQAASESVRLNDVKRKQTLRSPQNVCNDAMKYAGIGRGKYKTKPPHYHEYDRRIQDGSMLCNSGETNSDLIQANQAETSVSGNNSPLCNSPHSEEGRSTPKDSRKKNPLYQDADENDILPVQAQLNGAFPLHGDVRNRNMPPNVDHYYDYKGLPNGLEHFSRYRNNKPFRMNRMQHNTNSMQYNKGFDNRTFVPRYPAPMQPNVKTSYRPVNKGHDNHYRQNHHDNRRQQQSTRPPFPISIDKTVYKHKGNIYADRDFNVFEVNRNFPPQNFSMQNDISRHISGSVSYVSQTNAAAFRPKHHTPRIVNCDKIMYNKNEPTNNNPKTWNMGGIYPDSNTSTVSCHSSSVVTPMKTMVSRQCAICTSHPHEKHCPSLKEESLHNPKDFSGAKNINPEHSQTYTTDKTESGARCNSSPDYNIHNPRIPHNDNYNTVPNSERLAPNDHASSSAYEFLPANDVEMKNNSIEKIRSPDGNDPYLREKLGFPPMHLRKDIHSEKADTSPKVSPGNVPLLKQSSGDFCNSDNSNLTFLGDSHYLASSVPPHSSYAADVIHLSGNAVSKVSVCQISSSLEVAVPQSTDYSDTAHEKLHPKMEVDHANPSSEWIMTRLSQVDLNAGMVNVNGIVHPVTSNSQQTVNPRPIAVSLEKPSFYNSKIGIGINVPLPNLPSPERRMLECQFVEENLSNMLGYKKSGEKISFLSDLAAAGESACLPVNVRTDSTFSDTSSVCSSMSGTFKGEGHCQMVKANTPPVIIMNNNYGASENMAEISFGIEMDEIMKLCGDSDVDSVGDSSMTFLTDSGFCPGKVLDVETCEVEELEEERAEACSFNETEENMAGKFIVIGKKKFLWKDKVDISKCNLPQIVGFLQESIGESVTSAVKFYSEE